jgi:hypothetical protein
MGRQAVGRWRFAALAAAVFASACTQHRSFGWTRFAIEPAGGQPGVVSAGGFEACSGDWKAVDRVDAPTPPQVLQQDRVGAKDDFNLALVTGFSADQGTLSVKLRALDGEIDQGGGLVWRAQSPRDYYLARWNPLEKNVRCYVVKEGVRTLLGSAGVELGEGWHALLVAFDGARIAVTLDGVERLVVAHSAELPEGRFGVWTKADARTQFDDLEIAD